jgi:hypothetical protein
MGGTAFEKAPLILKTELIFPYDQGLRFVVHFRRHHPWRRIDALFKKPPLSTEQVLHPAKYDDYERPDEITEKPLPALAGRPLWYKNVFGELTLRTWLRQHGAAEAASSKAVAGWGGDRMVVYGPPDGGGAPIAISHSVWDEEADAIEFHEAASAAFAKLEQFSIERRGEAVVLLVGVPADQADALRADVFKRWTVKRR